MSNNELFFSLAGVVLVLVTFLVTFLKYYIDAKIDPVSANIKQLINYMVLYQGKIATLEERTKKL